MRFYKPEHAPEREPVSRANKTVTLAWADETEEFAPEEATEANSTQIEEIHEALEDVQTSLSDHQSSHTTITDRIAGLSDQVDDVTEQLHECKRTQASHTEQISVIHAAMDDLESGYEALEKRIIRIEECHQRHDSKLTTIGQQSDRVLAAVFDEERPCPQCRDGTITQSRGMLESVKIACDTCDFTMKIAVPW